MMRDITFLDKSFQNDFGCQVKSGKVPPPNKRKNKQQVAFSNYVEDFSELYGMQVYEERTLTYVIHLIDYKGVSSQRVYDLEEEINNFIMPGMRGQLIDSFMPDVYFEAEVITGPDLELLKETGEQTIEFVAYPFKIFLLEEGNDEWDPYNLEKGFSQLTEYQINGVQEIKLWNVGVNLLNPVIDSSERMTIEKEGQIYEVQKGENRFIDLPLMPGENNLTIKGNGLITFHFHRELI
ncbi:phage tail protein [Carnobacterium divergens]|uniref:Phage tail protein n=1 Tax=Carnobacterium divergens TaxID=2748 RepID=A0A7Z8G3D9_CARDV|nr:phage tail protein [Carnobacterium divergens]TFI70073.1 hypothetical protein CKN58_11620 [Carnobacterium divergens]TFI75067.1 hypothetical protein CKN85_11675 [Carnobacterium divergens]TFI80891.1 hypothetical protein CKN56_11705 [Carnobacterium divergens]TFI93298.1 hypothetical protein CKN64_11640 [Carnobacterium divergens]TFJ09330.1 hypothetical protein CKN60_11670 [Carnobacterium divergens]